MGWCQGDMKTVHHPEVTAPGRWATPGTGNHPGLIPRFNHNYCLLRRFLDLVVCRHYLSLCQFVAFKIFVHKPIKYDRVSYMNYSL